jgi:hypothetical protein
VSYKNKVDIVLADVPSNFLIPHIFESFSFIPPWNMRVDNFIESVVVFVNRFLSDKGAIIIMYVDDPHMLKEVCSFLESYQLKVHMKLIVVNSSPQMNSTDPSSQVPLNSLYPYVFTL